MEVIETDIVSRPFKLFWKWWHQYEILWGESPGSRVIVPRNPIKRFLYSETCATLGECLRFGNLCISKFVDDAPNWLIIKDYTNSGYIK